MRQGRMRGQPAPDSRPGRWCIGLALCWAGLWTPTAALAGAVEAVDAAATTPADTEIEAAQPAVWLPTDWPQGTRMRYALRWERAFPAALPLEPTLASGMQGVQTATVQVEVLRGGPADGVLRWQPRLDGADPDPGSDLALAMWRLMLAQTLEIRWQSGPDGALEYTVHNRAELQRRVWPELAALARHGGVEPRCEDTDARATPLCRLHTAVGLNDWLLGPVQGFFACVGMEIADDAVAEWSEPHPTPAIGAAVQVHHHHTWLPAQPDGRLRIHLRNEPDATQLTAWVRSQLDPSLRDQPLLQQWLTQFQLRTTVDCAMDTATGWPVTVAFDLQSGSDPAWQTRERSTLRQLPDTQ